MLATHFSHRGIVVSGSEVRSLTHTENICIFSGQVGFWKYSIQASSQTLTLTVTSRAASATLPPITVTPVVNKNTGKFPSPVTVYASIRQGASPILRASVTALIESVNGKTVTLELLDNGAGNHSRNLNLDLLLRYHHCGMANRNCSAGSWQQGT
jgi:calcium-activated chloride channel regulator 1